jgi:putative acetyltransferase
VPTPPVTIRPATNDDAEAMLALSLAAIDESATGDYEDHQLAAWRGRRTLEGHQRMVADTTAFVAVIDRRVAGFATVALGPVGALVAGEVDQLYVDPSFGGRGVARALLAAVATAATAAGIQELVTHASWRAAPVFERLGYRREQVETVHIDGIPITRVLMRAPTTTE